MRMCGARFVPSRLQTACLPLKRRGKAMSVQGIHNRRSAAHMSLQDQCAPCLQVGGLSCVPPFRRQQMGVFPGLIVVGWLLAQTVSSSILIAFDSPLLSGCGTLLPPRACGYSAKSTTVSFPSLRSSWMGRSAVSTSQKRFLDFATSRISTCTVGKFGFLQKDNNHRVLDVGSNLRPSCSVSKVQLDCALFDWCPFSMLGVETWCSKPHVNVWTVWKCGKRDFANDTGNAKYPTLR